MREKSSVRASIKGSLTHRRQAEVVLEVAFGFEKYDIVRKNTERIRDEEEEEEVDTEDMFASLEHKSGELDRSLTEPDDSSGDSQMSSAKNENTHLSDMIYETLLTSATKLSSPDDRIRKNSASKELPNIRLGGSLNRHSGKAFAS